jgi:hypothetical protein
MKEFKRHSKENQILEFLNNCKSLDAPINIKKGHDIIDIEKFSNSMISLIQSAPSKRQYNLAIHHTKVLKEAINNN